MSLTVPVSVTVLVLLLPIVTPPEVATLSVPLLTLRVTLTGLVPASTSLMLMPLIKLLLERMDWEGEARLTTGASLTAVTLTVKLVSTKRPPGSVARTVKLAAPKALAT